MRFVGIDLGWQSQPSGVCCLSYQDGSLQLMAIDRVEAIADVLSWIGHWLDGQEAGIAVDAPTLIPNQNGMRVPDRLAHQYFGRYHAGCYPANLNRPFAQRTIEFGRSLEERGFSHAPGLEAQQSGRFQIEVFPHPAIVHLFKLERILKYKKGRIAERRAELAKLRDYILNVLPLLEPALHFPAHIEEWIPAIPQQGAALKALEDQLDSLICAYVAAHWWYWGLERNWVLGDLATGYIVLPAPFT
jgi:predicted RNase H-like nuclease